MLNEWRDYLLQTGPCRCVLPQPTFPYWLPFLPFFSFFPWTFEEIREQTWSSFLLWCDFCIQVVFKISDPSRSQVCPDLPSLQPHPFSPPISVHTQRQWPSYQLPEMSHGLLLPWLIGERVVTQPYWQWTHNHPEKCRGYSGPTCHDCCFMEHTTHMSWLLFHGTYQTPVLWASQPTTQQRKVHNIPKWCPGLDPSSHPSLCQEGWADCV